MSETEISRSGSNPERRSKQAVKTIKRLFKAAVKAIMPRDADARPQKKRSGEKHGGGPMMLVKRAAGRPAARGRYGALHAAATDAGGTEDLLHKGSTWDVFDITGIHYEHGFDDGIAATPDTKTNHLSPGL